eukprot:3956009-Pleurochrysis_carterae.AAC.1
MLRTPNFGPPRHRGGCSVARVADSRVPCNAGERCGSPTSTSCCRPIQVLQPTRELRPYRQLQRAVQVPPQLASMCAR